MYILSLRSNVKFTNLVTLCATNYFYCIVFIKLHFLFNHCITTRTKRLLSYQIMAYDDGGVVVLQQVTIVKEIELFF